MSFIIEKKPISFRETYVIKNREGVQIWRVEKKILSSDFVFLDNSNNEMFVIKHELISFHPSCKILDSNGSIIVKINKEFKLFGTSFSIEDENKRKIFDISGDLLKCNYIFVNSNGSIVARVHKELINLIDSYCLDISEKIDPRIALGACIAIDALIK